MQNSYIVILKNSHISVVECEENEMFFLKKNAEKEQSYKSDVFWEWFKDKIEYEDEALSFILFSDTSNFMIPCEANIVLAEKNSFAQNMPCQEVLLTYSNTLKLFTYPQESAIVLQVDHMKTLKQEVKKHKEDEKKQQEKEETIEKSIHKALFTYKQNLNRQMLHLQAEETALLNKEFTKQKPKYQQDINALRKAYDTSVDSLEKELRERIKDNIDNMRSKNERGPSCERGSSYGISGLPWMKITSSKEDIDDLLQNMREVEEINIIIKNYFKTWKKQLLENLVDLMIKYKFNDIEKNRNFLNTFIIGKLKFFKILDGEITDEINRISEHQALKEHIYTWLSISIEKLKTKIFTEELEIITKELEEISNTKRIMFQQQITQTEATYKKVLNTIETSKAP